MFHILLRVRWHVLITVGALAPALVTHAQTSCEPQSPITSEALVRLALECSPEQRAAVARWQSQAHEAEAAGRLADPQLMLSAAPKTFGDERLDDGYVVELNQSVPWPGTLSQERRAASARADAWRARADESEVDLARRIRLAFAEWQFHLELFAINKQHRQLWQEFIAIVEAKYAAGTTTKSAVLQATHEAHQLAEEAIELEAALERDASIVKQLVGLPAHVDLSSWPVNSPESVSLPVTLAALLERLDQQPRVRRVRAERENAAAELALAEKDRYPNFSVMARYNSLWMNEEQRWMVGVGVNLPLDFAKRSSQEKSVKARETALRWEHRDVENRLRAQIVQAHSLWEQAHRTYQLYQRELLPLAQENLATSHEAYSAGSGDFLSLLTAQRQTLSTQRRAEMAERAQLTAYADLAAAAGLVWFDKGTATNQDDNLRGSFR